MSVAGSSGAQTTIITGNAVTYDGATAILIEIFTALFGSGSATSILEIYRDSTSLGRIAQIGPVANVPVLAAIRETPAAGSHTYTLKGWVSSGTAGTFAATAPFVPGFLRITSS